MHSDIKKNKIFPDKSIPKHLAIIMDGNGRWALKKSLSRHSGHLEGVHTVHKIIKDCLHYKVKYLTLFAFSSENWRRPIEEITNLITIFINVLKAEMDRITDSGICFNVIGNLSVLDINLRKLILEATNKTLNNKKLYLTLAINYGGRWDILQAIKSMLSNNKDIHKNMDIIDEKFFSNYLSMSWAPDPDLIIRTGGEQRISNFLIWNLAYTEIYFTNKFWPEFNSIDLELALNWYSTRERRFGGLNVNKNKILKVQ
ncbi:Isoprenyl transferase [Candidatus Kinetoplastibacterium sorsogonicusi]|uniref:Isoprenyl transferase n=1 Tax=Candidatus Kinetoplastidibacterium kentomonadis TaxID=1576550 RepID=A0A3S7J9S8_9PROT|nr:polyprenyl diphosphate synthase [Candidatus Kinetoplastibacterium sorsogonicusi]AWD32428.1 Isoprenyl transferase [Candidatus Kinetoplastibacterium sorsogonicusi]